MKYSIKVKLFLTFSLLIFIFVAMSWLLNVFFLDSYYNYSKKNSLINGYNQILNAYSEDPNEIALELDNLQQNKGMQIVILNKDFETKYDSLYKRNDGVVREPNRNGRPNPPSFSEFLVRSKAKQILPGKTIIENWKDDRLNSNFIRLFAMLKNGDYILISTPVEAIKESAETANTFLIFTGLITIVIGSFIVFLIVGKITRPILELNEISQRMATLDFSSRYQFKSKDEIGQLGQSINSLSEQLQKSINGLQEANQLLREDNKRKYEIDEMRKEFISNISHELKTPLALVQGYTEGLKLNVNEDEENKNYYCDVIIDEASKMNRLVRKLTELSQIEYGSNGMEKENFSINQLLEQVLKKNELILKNKDIQVAVQKNQQETEQKNLQESQQESQSGTEQLCRQECQHEITVNADYYMIEQVLSNYLNNAINHVDDKKEIKIEVKQKDDNKTCISVFNSGRNIPEDSLEKIWISFYKVDKARTRDYGGSGLGLSIVRATLEAHGNKYGVKNKKDGVEFWFELDVAG